MRFMLNYCPHCGTQIKNEHKICSKCGYNLVNNKNSISNQEVPNPINFGKNNVITHPDIKDVNQTVNKIEHIKISPGLTEDQFRKLTLQLDNILQLIGISKDVTKENDFDLNDDQRKIIEAVEEKVREGDDVFDKPIGNPETYLRLGNKAFSEGSYDIALQKYDRVLLIDSECEEAWINKGECLDNLGKSKEALECFYHALAINPEGVETWILRGIAFKNVEEIEQSFACFNRALELDPENEYVWISIGNALRDLGKLEDALLFYDQFLNINPDNDYVWNLRGIILDDVEKKDEALFCYKKAVELNQANADAWNNIGVSYDDAGYHHKAIDCFNKALDLNQDDVTYKANKESAVENIRNPEEDNPIVKNVGEEDNSIEISKSPESEKSHHLTKYKLLLIFLTNPLFSSLYIGFIMVITNYQNDVFWGFSVFISWTIWIFYLAYGIYQYFKYKRKPKSNSNDNKNGMSLKEFIFSFCVFLLIIGIFSSSPFIGIFVSIIVILAIHKLISYTKNLDNISYAKRVNDQQFSSDTMYDLIDASPSISGHLDNTNQWPDQSVLKSVYGYSVREGVSFNERRQCLRNAVNGQGKAYVIHHISSMINLNKRRWDSKMDEAIKRWEQDLEFVSNNL